MALVPGCAKALRRTGKTAAKLRFASVQTLIFPTISFRILPILTLFTPSYADVVSSATKDNPAHASGSPIGEYDLPQPNTTPPFWRYDKSCVLRTLDYHIKCCKKSFMCPCNGSELDPTFLTFGCDKL